MAKRELPKEFTDRLEFAALSDEEKSAIIVRAQKHVEDERKAKAEEAFLDFAIEEERRKHKPKEQYEDVLIDLPGHAVRLLIDGVEYIHSFTYRVTGSQAQSMREQMQRCWSHEHEVGGANRNFYQRPRNIRIGPNNLNTANSSLMGNR